MKKNTWAVLGLAAVIALALVCAGCTSSTTSTAPSNSSATSGSGTKAPNTISEKNYTFVPSTLTVKVGDTVTFSNDDSVPHHVFVGTADLGEQQPGQSVAWTADKDETLALRCSIHPSMTGQITVGSGGGAASPPAGGTGTGGGSGAPPAGGSGAPPAGGSGAPPAGGSGGYGY